MFESFEQISSGSKSVRVFFIYRPPPSKVNKLKECDFTRDFSNLMECFPYITTSILVTGDFNFHVDDATDSSARNFLSLLESADLQPIVDRPTHIHGHILDLLIMRGGDDIVTDLNIDYSLPSDHFAVLCRLKLSKPSASKITVTSRKLRSINVEEFKQDVRSSSLFTEPCNDLKDIVCQ